MHGLNEGHIAPCKIEEEISTLLVAWERNLLITYWSSTQNICNATRVSIWWRYCDLEKGWCAYMYFAKGFVRWVIMANAYRNTTTSFKLGSHHAHHQWCCIWNIDIQAPTWFVSWQQKMIYFSLLKSRWCCRVWLMDGWLDRTLKPTVYLS